MDKTSMAGAAFERNRVVGAAVAQHAAARRGRLLERALRSDQPSEVQLRTHKRGQAAFVLDPFSGRGGDAK